MLSFTATLWHRNHPALHYLSIVLCLPVLLTCIALNAKQQVSDQISPESATGITAKTVVLAKKHLAVTANPYASQAALSILQQGGSAIDAMISAQLVLGLVEPQSSGIGGGAFLLYYDNKGKQLLSLDGRETAPSSANEQLFLDAQKQPMEFFDAVVGGRSVGVPGVVELMWQSHQRHGKLAWAALFEPAITLAKEGFIVSERLAQLVALDQQRLSQQMGTKAYFFTQDGSPIRAGQWLKNPDYVKTLRVIAKQGSAGFYQGEVAQAIVNTVQKHPTNPGGLNLTDLQHYQVKTRPNTCINYQQIYQICGMGLPSSGGITVGQILGISEFANLNQYPANSPQAWRIIGDATRLAFADRARYMADPDFTPDHSQDLLSTSYLKQRAALLQQTDLALPEASAGEPKNLSQQAQRWAPQTSQALPSTTHLVIHDQYGNLVSMTSSIENVFGSRLMVGGFLLNNQLTDFSFQASHEGKAVANRVEANKRPRSSMAPTLVFKNKQPYLALGSPGGSRIINYVSQTLIAHLSWGLPLQQAIEMPHLVNQSGRYDLEQGTAAEQLAPNLTALGYQTQVTELNSGLHGLVITPQGLISGVDPRREGLALGE